MWWIAATARPACPPAQARPGPALPPWICLQVAAAVGDAIRLAPGVVEVVRRVECISFLMPEFKVDRHVAPGAAAAVQ